MIEVETPDGGIAEFPDGTSADVIKAALRKRFPAPAPTVASGKGDRVRSTGETLADVGMGAAQGFQTGFQSLLGSLGDAQKATGDFAAWGAGQLGFSPETQQTARNIGSRVPTMGLAIPAPTTEQVNTAFESVIGPKYQPQTTEGQYARTIGEFAPAAMAGPGGVVRKTGMAVIPGVATEAAGQISDQNPYARAAAGIGAAVVTAGRGGTGTKEMLKNVGNVDPAYAAVKARADEAYTALRSAGIRYDANNIDNTIQDVAQIRINEKLAPNAFALREELAAFAGKGMDFQDLDELEQIGTSLLRDNNVKNADKMLTGAVLNKIRSIRNGAVATNGTVPANEVNALIATAKDYGRRNILARDIKGMEKKSQWYLGGEESGLRNKFASYGRSKGQNLSKAEEKAFKSVVHREGVLNPLHTAGTRLGQLAIGSAGMSMGGIPAAVVSLVGSAAARKFMEVYTKKGVETAIKTVLAGKSAQDKAAVRDLIAKAEAQARLAVSADAAVRNNAPEPSPGLVGVPR